MKRFFLTFNFWFLLLMTLQSCKTEDTYTHLTDEAKALLLYDVGDTFQLRNTSTDEVITLSIISKTFDYDRDSNPGSPLGSPGGDDYYENGDYFFIDDTNCYLGSVAVEARRNGNFEFSIGTDGCFGEFMTTSEFNSVSFAYNGEMTSLNIDGTEYPEAYILNASNHTIYYTKEHGILQIIDDINGNISFVIVN